MIRTIVIAAAGQGTRMKHLSEDKPKHLVRVAGKPFLHYVLHAIHAAGFERIIVVVGYHAEKMEAFLADQPYDITVVNQLEKMGDKAAKAIEDMWDFYYMVNTEDFEVCEKTQIGIQADAFTGGRMVYAYEESLNRYHKMIANCMTGVPYIIPKGDSVPSYFDSIPVYNYKQAESSSYQSEKVSNE